MILPDYLVRNVDKIKSLPEQNIALWNKSYDYFIDAYSVIQDLYNLFPTRSIQRKDVIQLFEKDYFIGFLAAMMWGGINATQSKERKDTNFGRLLEYTVKKRRELDQSIQYAEKQIKKGNFKELFLSFDSGFNKIPGVGPAYFTKLFFFLGEINDVKIKPLIFDKWTSNAHCALSIQQILSYPERKFYYSGMNNYYKYLLNYSSKEDLYVQYVNDLNSWANTLEIPASKLEQFLFGFSLKTNKVKTNPRLELWDIIENHFTTFHIENIPLTFPETTESLNHSFPELSSKDKYYPLQLELKKALQNNISRVSLTIDEIEEMIMQPLPDWAFTRAKSFWGNSGSQYHVQKSAWLSQGFKVILSNVTQERNGIITFIKN